MPFFGSLSNAPWCWAAIVIHGKSSFAENSGIENQLESVQLLGTSDPPPPSRTRDRRQIPARIASVDRIAGIWWDLKFGFAI